jgi:hypothetical protein
MTIKGVSESVVALLDEFDGIRNWSVSAAESLEKRSVKILRADASSPVAPSTNQVVEDRSDPPPVQAPCPVCGEQNVSAVLASSDGNLRVLRVRLVCPNAPEWEVELPQAGRTS